jgi:hypothetical protein
VAIIFHAARIHEIVTLHQKMLNGSVSRVAKIREQLTYIERSVNHRRDIQLPQLPFRLSFYVHHSLNHCLQFLISAFDPPLGSRDLDVASRRGILLPLITDIKTSLRPRQGARHLILCLRRGVALPNPLAPRLERYRSE